MKSSWIIGGIVGVGLLTIVGSYVSAANYGNRAENGIKATWENNENVLANYTTRIGEMAQIPAMQRDDLKEVYKSALEGRYGQNGSGAVMQWIKEQNPQLDPALYSRLQVAIEAGRKDFEVEQTKLIDQKRAYSTELGTVWRGMWLGLAGYPKINLADYKAITNTKARNAFVTGMDEGLTIRPAAPAASPTPAK